MFRGTTPTIEIEFDFETSLISCLFATFVQKDSKVFEKCLTDCNCEGNTAYLTLTQADTLKLKANEKAFMQVRVKLLDGTSLTDTPLKFDVKDVFKEGEI